MKNINQPHTNKIPKPALVIQKVIDFLLLFIPKVLAKRAVAIILLAADAAETKSKFEGSSAGLIIW